MKEKDTRRDRVMIDENESRQPGRNRAGGGAGMRRRGASGVSPELASPAARRTHVRDTSLSRPSPLTPPPTRHTPQRPRTSNQHRKSQMGKNEVDSKGIPLKSSHP